MKTKGRKQRDVYLELVKTFPLRPVRNQEACDEAMSVVKQIMLYSDHVLSQEEKDYVEALTTLVLEFERKQPPLDLGPSDPISLLKHVMEEHGMNVNDLGKVLGSQPMASLILNRKRQLSKANIKKLAAHFHLNPSLFL